MEPRQPSRSLRSQKLSRRPEGAPPAARKNRRSRVLGTSHHTDPGAQATFAVLLWALLKRPTRTTEDFSTVRAAGRFFSRRATRRQAYPEPRPKTGFASSVGRSDSKSFRTRPTSLRWQTPRGRLHHPASCHPKDPRTSERQSQRRPSPSSPNVPPPPGSSIFKQRWAELIKKVYEADPLVCPRCGGAMRIIAFIDQPDVIEKILTHLGLWPYLSHAPPPSAVA